MIISRASLLPFVLIVVLIFPAFGGVWGEQHVMLTFLIFSLFVVVLVKSRFKINDFFPVIIFSFLQFLLLISWWEDLSEGSANLSDIPSLLRPTAFILFYLAILSIMLDGCHIKFINRFVIGSAIVLAFFFIVQLIFGVGETFNVLYFSNEKFRDFAFVSVFGTTYFAVYFYYIIFVFSLCQLAFDRFSLRWFSVFLISTFFIFFSQGKSGYLAALFTILALTLIKLRFIGRVALVFISVVSVYWMYLFNDKIALYMREAGYFSLSQMSILFDDGLEFSNVAIRLQQIYDSYSGSLENYYFGIGLGRDVYLESYLASYTHRYGLIGLFLYHFFYFSLILFAILRYRKSKDVERKVIYAFCGLWFLNIPIIMLSNPMFEMGKNSIFSMFVLALLFSADRLKMPGNTGGS